MPAEEEGEKPKQLEQECNHRADILSDQRRGLNHWAGGRGSGEGQGPAVRQCLRQHGRRGRLTMASVSLQDLRRRLYVKAKADKDWQFWGLHVHVAKVETLRAAYDLAKRN